MSNLKEYDDQNAIVSIFSPKTGDSIELGSVGDKVNLPDGDRDGTADTGTFESDVVTVRILNRKIEGLYVTEEQEDLNLNGTGYEESDSADF